MGNKPSVGRAIPDRYKVTERRDTLARKATQFLDHPSIGSPFQVIRVSHVSESLTWYPDAEDGEERIMHLTEKIGKGAFGQVYKGVLSSGYPVAVKTVPKKSDEVVQDLKKEISILKKCNHPNIVSYFGSMESQKDDESVTFPGEDVVDHLWIFMDLCAFGSVKDFAKAKHLSEDQIASILKDTICGLEYLHSLKIIHRDVKAANILLDGEGVAKLADFGISKQLETMEASTDTVVGTTHWMAPEIILSNTYDSKCDIWSLGITAFEISEGHPPHNELTNFQFLTLLTKATKVEDIVTFPEGFQMKNLMAFAYRCLKMDAKERPTALELKKDPFVEPANRGSLKSSLEKINQAKPEKILNISILEGASLPIEDLVTRSSDPYCILQIQKEDGTVLESFRTATIKNTIDPVWNESFQGEIDPSEAKKLVLYFWDKDYFKKDDFLGVVSLPLDSFSIDGRHRWLDLAEEEAKKPTGERGSVRIKLEWEADRQKKLKEVCEDLFTKLMEIFNSMSREVSKYPQVILNLEDNTLGEVNVKRNLESERKDIEYHFDVEFPLHLFVYDFEFRSKDKQILFDILAKGPDESGSPFIPSIAQSAWPRLVLNFWQRSY